MDVNSLPKTVTRQRRGCDLNPGPSAPESSMLTTRLPSHPNWHGLAVILSVYSRGKGDCSIYGKRQNLAFCRLCAVEKRSVCLHV